MENQKTLLYFTLFFIIYLLWAQWQTDYGPQPVAPVAVETTDGQAVIDSDVPAATIASPGTRNNVMNSTL